MRKRRSVFLSDESFWVWDFQDKKEPDQFVLENLMKATSRPRGANDPKAINFTGHLRNFENVITAIENKVPPFISGAESINRYA
ncbi:MAG: hypothetical protein H6569_05995 [Lewinellaceae bacterium]|nr:hypothetical protein [Lewinellaceae bacterium]